MAIASLHTIPVLGDSPRQVLRQVADEGGRRTQASSVLQMWREIEDVHTGSGVEQRTTAFRQRSDEFNDDISTQTSESNCSEQRAYMEEMDENMGCSSLSEDQSGMEVGGSGRHDKSPAIGNERQRVRQIFQDWMNCSGRGHSLNAHQMSGSSRAQWLGDNECERVRVVREWLQLTAQDRSSHSGIKEGTEIGAQIEMVHDGLVFNQNDGRPNRVHRKIRRLCGKQALLDLLVKAEKERQSELQDLTKHHAVSKFPHRNRIQSLLKGRFLRNNISSAKQIPRSTAAGELGLLRQRNTVSDLREGFLSRMDSSGQSQVASINDHTSSSSDANETGTKDSQTGIEEEITGKMHEQNDSAKEQSAVPDDSEETRHSSSVRVTIVNEQALLDDELVRQEPAGAEWTISSPGAVAEEILPENTSNASSQCYGREEEMASQIQNGIDLSRDRSESINQGSDFCESSACMNESGVTMVEDLNLEGHSTEDEAMNVPPAENEDGRMDGVAYNDWRNTINIDMGTNGIARNVHGQSPYAAENEMEESVTSGAHDVWDASESEESVEDGLQRSSRQVSGASSSSDTFYGLEDNERTSELNELVGRRRVSNLLESGFRENLNRLLQTYVERQAQASVGWDLNDSMSSPVSEVLYQEQQTENQSGHFVDTFGPFNHPQRIRPGQIWHQVPWTRTVHQPPGFDWDVISDLRMDITTLQLRMNDMQRMLEACMDLQLELQRSIRQEVSAALNRSVLSESSDAGLPDDKSKWDLVRQGICCVCSHSSIDSLLYRCGHMCTCTKCANQLLEEKSKCPMCRSPIVEVIRAYSLQQ
uniref:RING-type domain-containing protein n=1 Tax=Kalanchoe fedtschenkoi TaxID=63787 RepID=A0A7N0UT51_KALFE